ncbi:MAG: rhodanese-like domain-containing protein [Acidimicrobiales bacterium]
MMRRPASSQLRDDVRVREMRGARNVTLNMKKSVQQMIDEARKHIDNHPPEEAKRRVEEEGALLIDVRDVRELERDGVIPGAMHAPRGMLEFWIDPESPYFREVFNEDREFILY